MLEWERKRVGLNPGLSSVPLLGESKCCVDTLVIIMMVWDYHLKMVGGFQKLSLLTEV